MQKKSIILIIFIILILLVMGYVYFIWEKPQKQVNEQLVNISIVANNKLLPDQNIEINYEIVGSNFSFSKPGKTLKGGDILEKLPFNRSYIIKTIFTENETYYFYSKEFNTFSLENQRVRLSLDKSGELEIKGKGFLGIDNPLNITLTLKRGEEYRNPIYCIDGGFHLFNLKTNNTQIIKLDEYKLWNYCYELNSINITNNKETIYIYYELWASIDDKDYLNISIMDRDLIDENYVYNSVGGKDYNFIFEF